MKVAICTLGCKVNQYETQALEQELLHRGHTLADFEETADAYVVNTCSVTAVSDKKSRQMLRQARRRNPSAVIAACGCYAQTHPEDVKKLGLDVIAGTNDRAKFIDLLERAAQDKTPIVDVDDVWERRDFEVLPAGGMVNRTRAMLKVEDGCVNFCTYCLIPYARGRVRSLPMDEAAKQVKALREEGYREIVVTGIEISSYGSDFKDGTSLIDLLELIAREGGDMRIRLGSLEPRTITEEFCKRASKLPYLCPHFHLSMQSGCDATLKRMNRKYDTARYMESCDLLRQYFDDPAITTDLITGFPEETEEEFAQTLDFIARVGFADMHVFPYSIRPGTKAAEMRQIDMPVREERAARASAVAKTMHEAYLACCVGKIFPVLFERDRKGGSAGHAPNYMEVSVAQEGLHNQVKNVKITAVDGGSLRGELEESRMANHFYAYISRMRCVKRWALMRNTEEENIQEHSHMVAVLAHALALIRMRVFGLPTDANAVAVAALYHDATEILTGDMPTPIKYYNPEIRDAYRKVEAVASDKLLSMLPDELRADYEPIIKIEDETTKKLVKAADKLSAYIKCVEELKAGNMEFKKAAEQTRRALSEMHMPELDYFMVNCMESFSMTLDELE